MSATQAQASPFATLLRRSKFASYDPSIGQVYTTHGGHAHRGNWGLKRPLPNRRRTGFITVRGVDSLEEQTEWNSAEFSARWMRRWEELGKKLEPHEMGIWYPKTDRSSWRTDTEFDRAGREGLEPGREQQREDVFSDTSNMVPNPDAMSPQRFQKYLDHLRDLRPEFKEYLKISVEEKWKKQSARTLPSEQATLKLTASGEIDMLLSGSNSGPFVTEFLEHRARGESNPKFKRLTQHPHKFAGLEYTYMSALQSQYLHKPAPGRAIGQNVASRYEGSQDNNKHNLIAVGGLIGKLPKVNGRHTTMVVTDFGTRDKPRTDKERGKEMFRVSKVKLVDAPATVGRFPQTANDAKLGDIEFTVARTALANRSNPHPLGSPEYVAQVGMTLGKGGHPVPSSLVRHVRRPPLPLPSPDDDPAKPSTELIGRLGNMLSEQTDI